MSQKRPGGLTALAVLNFVFGGLGLLSLLGIVVMFKYASQLSANASPQDKAVFQAFQDLGLGFWAVIVIISVISSAMLITAGVGYLKTKRWGRTLGNLYALLTIGHSILEAVIMPSELGGGVQLGTLIGLVYPVLTLILINTTFKDDFV